MNSLAALNCYSSPCTQKKRILRIKQITDQLVYYRYLQLGQITIDKHFRFKTTLRIYVGMRITNCMLLDV